MSIVASTVPPSNPIPARCPGCGTPIPGSDPGTCCSVCRRSQVEHEAHRLLRDLYNLARGTGVFSELPEEDRREQIRALLLPGEPESKPEHLLRAFVDSLPDAWVDALADLVSRRIADRKRKRGVSVPTLVRVAIADLSHTALIDLVGETEDSILLNAASAELVERLCEQGGAGPEPLYTRPENAEPDSRTRYELEGRIEVEGEQAPSPRVVRFRAA